MLRNANNKNPDSIQISEEINSLEARNKSLTVAWIAGHCVVEANEEVDKAAKESCFLRNSNRLNTQDVILKHSISHRQCKKTHTLHVQGRASYVFKPGYQQTSRTRQTLLFRHQHSLPLADQPIELFLVDEDKEADNISVTWSSRNQAIQHSVEVGKIAQTVKVSLLSMFLKCDDLVRISSV
ncbi:hypothetical protein HELRODRAFT_170964 [Helobdella robusta]|uniref:Uncharacterized protein n=1 Tax=Helobdella robusta TaxID=6412 RepID=T1F3M8_HELRO|nr:hypothetical protein HELRODRAFT_170964 [Helobdella robusta]ESO06929.1 hypothetical protein HELRODRAFT_170964 [Helobdella robusta]